MEEGRAKVTAGGGVTQQAVAGFRSSEAVVELFSADVDGRRGTEDTVVAGSGDAGKATAVTLKAQEQDNLLRQKKEIVGKVEEQMKQLPLGADKVPKWRAIFSAVM